uniref:Integrase catalytic domain-containing protein n=1 Tax=Gasterosteus aculeatus aculeatus TaxID=481459 RepID=A0AAQ4P7E4_GASAC
MLEIQGVKTSPYHPQTDGLVERFNKTLKSMLKKFVNYSGSDWDRWLPFVLFAYREVPQASTGFSPFQRLYGHPVRGPMDVLNDAWEGPMPQQQCSELSYVLKMRGKLNQYQELANGHLADAQQRQKRSYDKASKRRIFQEGQKVLLLLPTSDSGLLAKWQGQYKITKKLALLRMNSFYQISGKRIKSVNLLKEWVDQSEQSLMWARTVVDEEELQEQYFPTSTETPVFPDLSHLEPGKRRKLQAFMHKDLFSLKPGCTNLIDHHIHLYSPAQRPIRDTTCCIPARLVPGLKQEVEEMLATGIIEPLQ